MDNPYKLQCSVTGQTRTKVARELTSGSLYECFRNSRVLVKLNDNKCCMRDDKRDLTSRISLILQGAVVRKVDSVFQRIVSFSTTAEKHKKQRYQDIELTRGKKWL